MGYLKQDEVKGNGKRGKKTNAGKRSTKPPQQPAVLPAALDVDMSGVEVELANIARSVRSYVVNAVDGENSLALFTGSAAGGYSPVRLVLEGEAVEGIAEALTRIADALAARPLTHDGGAGQNLGS